MDLECRCKPSIFAYPPPAEEKDKKELQKAPTAVLSTTAKAKARAVPGTCSSTDGLPNELLAQLAAAAAGSLLHQGYRSSIASPKLISLCLRPS